MSSLRHRIAVTVLVLAFFAQRCSPECELEVIANAVSPDKSHVATVFVENCHATAPFVTAVNVRCATCALDPNDHVLAIGGRSPVTVRWERNDALAIRYESGAEVFERESHGGRISVTYSVAPPGSAPPPAEDRGSG